MARWFRVGFLIDKAAMERMSFDSCMITRSIIVFLSPVMKPWTLIAILISRLHTQSMPV
jgi:hypothetical protein